MQDMHLRAWRRALLKEPSQVRLLHQTCAESEQREGMTVSDCTVLSGLAF